MSTKLLPCCGRPLLILHDSPTHLLQAYPDPVLPTLYQNSVPSPTPCVKSKLINLATCIFPSPGSNHPSSVSVVRLSLPITHLPGKDRTPPGLLHKSCILPNNLTHHPALPSLLFQGVICSQYSPARLLPCKGRPSLLYQEVIFSLSSPAVLIPCKGMLSLDHLQVILVLSPPLCPHTCLGLSH